MKNKNAPSGEPDGAKAAVTLDSSTHLHNTAKGVVKTRHRLCQIDYSYILTTSLLDCGFRCLAGGFVPPN